MIRKYKLDVHSINNQVVIKKRNVKSNFLFKLDCPICCFEQKMYQPKGADTLSINYAYIINVKYVFNQ